MVYQNTEHRSGLMNLISEFVVKLLNEDNNTKTNISVTDHKNFVVINGQTDSKKIMSVNDLRTLFTKEMSNSTSLYDINNVSIIDLIEYKESKNVVTPKNMTFVFYNSTLPRFSQEQIDKVIELEKTNYSDVISYEFGVMSLTPNENYFQLPCQSKFPYGYSLNNWKGIFLYFEYISLNVFPMIKGSSLKFEIQSDMSFNVTSDSLYEADKIESMIKDVFDMNLGEFLTKINNYDLTKDCLLFVDRPWLVKDRVRDAIIF